MCMASIRTSSTDPLRIASVACLQGAVGITFCPGKCGSSLHGCAWRRDLALDLDAIQRWGAGVVITLVEPHELEMLGVPGLGPAVRARGMDWLHLPIVDVQPPSREFGLAWQRTVPGLIARLGQGERVLVHCRGGLGRAGTVAALILREAGLAADDAIARVRAVRPGAIETTAQAAYVKRYKPVGQEEGHDGLV